MEQDLILLQTGKYFHSYRCADGRVVFKMARTREGRCAMGVVLVPVFKLQGSTYLVTITNFRRPLGKKVLQLPGGYCEPGQTELQAGERQLLEETGYRIKTVIAESPLMYCDYWKSDQSQKVFMVEVQAKAQEQRLQPDEDIQVRVVKVDLNLKQNLVKLAQQQGLQLDFKLVWLSAALKV